VCPNSICLWSKCCSLTNWHLKVKTFHTTCFAVRGALITVSNCHLIANRHIELENLVADLCCWNRWLYYSLAALTVTAGGVVWCIHDKHVKHGQSHIQLYSVHCVLQCTLVCADLLWLLWRRFDCFYLKQLLRICPGPDLGLSTTRAALNGSIMNWWCPILHCFVAKQQHFVLRSITVRPNLIQIGTSVIPCPCKSPHGGAHQSC